MLHEKSKLKPSTQVVLYLIQGGKTMIGRRNWIKLYVHKILRGTLFTEMRDPAERFVWFGFLLLAGDSPIEGKIAVTKRRGMDDILLADILEVEVELLQSAKEKMVRHRKIELLPNNVIKIVNWKSYQSDYSKKKASKIGTIQRRTFRSPEINPNKTPKKSPNKTPS